MANFAINGDFPVAERRRGWLIVRGVREAYDYFMRIHNSVARRAYESLSSLR